MVTILVTDEHGHTLCLMLSVEAAKRVLDLAGARKMGACRVEMPPLPPEQGDLFGGWRGWGEMTDEMMYEMVDEMMGVGSAGPADSGTDENDDEPIQWPPAPKGVAAARNYLARFDAEFDSILDAPFHLTP